MTTVFLSIEKFGRCPQWSFSCFLWQCLAKCVHLWYSRYLFFESISTSRKMCPWLLWVIPVGNVHKHWLDVFQGQSQPTFHYELPLDRWSKKVWATCGHSLKLCWPSDIWLRWWGEVARAVDALWRGNWPRQCPASAQGWLWSSTWTVYR